jgi:hypothetical protein
MTTLATQTQVSETIFGQKSAAKGPSVAGFGTSTMGCREGAAGVTGGRNAAKINESAAIINESAAIEAAPVAGPAVTIRIGLTPANIVLFAAPVTVAIVMGLAWVVLKSVGLPLYMNEMVAAGIVSTVGGMLASVPLFVLMGKGAQMIAKAGILAIAVRCSMVLFGMVLAMQPAWGLAKMPFVYWVLGFYFPMLIVETGLVAWLSMKAKF